MTIPATPLPVTATLSARPLYRLLWLAALPFVLLRLWWRSRQQPAYRAHLGERFGRYRTPALQPLIWVHAVSVGETRAAEPLVRALLAGHPEHRVLLTHMTPTGRQTGHQLFADEPRVTSAYLPYDIPLAVRWFVRHFRPHIGLIMETELWPELLLTCREAGIPTMLINARLSARSARRYARWPALTRLTLEALSAIGCQSDTDAERLAAVGAKHLTVTGNIKFDITPPAAQLALGATWRTRLGTRPVILAASTRDGEEALILDAFVTQAPADALLVLVPRHPQRFDTVAEQVRARGLSLQRRSSSDAPVAADTRVWLGDSMGEMFAYYATADVALIGGSWLPLGGQNLIEACAVGTPVILGPHTFNFAQVADQAIAAGAAIRAADIATGMQEARALLMDAPRRHALSHAGRSFAATHRGATQRTCALVERVLGDPRDAAHDRP